MSKKNSRKRYCEHCGKEINNGHGLCEKHYRQLKRYGAFLEDNQRDENDPNEIVFYDDYAEIILYDDLLQEELEERIIIDLEDVEKIKNYKWSLKNGYAFNTEVGLLHRFLNEYPNDMVIDHINLNKLDNRRSNLRICTYSQNNMNTKIKSSNTSGTKGVWWNAKREKWIAEIMIDNKKYYLGEFINKEEAIKTRKEAEIKYFGEFRNK